MIADEIKARIIRDKIASIEEQEFGLVIDHEVQRLVGNADKVREIESMLANCVKILRMLNQKLEELSAPVVEHVNGKES